MEIKEVIGLLPADRDPVTGDYEGHCVSSDYTYVLPAEKVCFVRDNDLKWTAIIERIDENEKKVCVSQVNWFYMHHIIKYLYRDVKVTKRYPGRLTLCVLRDSLEEVDKNDIKKLSEVIGEKIVIKKAKEEIKIPAEPVKSNTVVKPVPVVVNDKNDNEKKLIDYIMARNEVDIKKNGYRFFLTRSLGKSNTSIIKIETTNRRFEYFYKVYTTDNLTEKKQVVVEAAEKFFQLILQDKPL